MAKNDSTDPERKAAIKLLKSGKASPSEVSALAKVSRQLVRHWINVDRVNWRKARREYLKAAWRKLV